MKKTLLCLMLISALVLCGCQPTPDEEYVVNKGDDKAGEAIEATAVPSEPIVQPVFPEHWEDDIKTDNAEMVIDADIITAGQETYPVHLVGKHSFTPEETARAVNAFFTDMTGLQEGAGYTYEDYERALSAVAELELDDRAKADLLEQLRENMKNTSKRDVGFAEADSFSEQLVKSGKSTDYMVRREDGSTGAVNCNGSELCLSLNAYCTPHTKTTVERLGGYYYGDSAENVKASIPLEEAVSKAREFFESIGAEGYELAESEDARILHCNTLQTISTGWEMKFVRSFGYAPVNAFEHESAASGASRIGRVGDDPYSYGWKCERIEIYVSEKGVGYFDWHDPLEYKGVSNENVRLMNFDDFGQIVTRYFSAKLGDPDMLHIAYYKLEDITLSVVPVAKRDTREAYMMPVWVCGIGLYHSMEDPGYSGFYYPGEQAEIDRMTVAFNAIDGTRVVVPQG